MLEEKLRALENQYAELEARLAAPETYADPARVAQLNREQRELEPVVTAYRAYERRKRDLADAEALLSDPDMKELAQEEYTEAKADVARLEEEIRVLLLPRDPNDGKNVIVEIRAGVGGEEAALFANSLYRMYAMYAEARRWNVEVTSLSDTELGGIKEICFTIDGEGAYSRLKFESGVHRVQRVPETESGGRIHTSTVTVAVLPEVDEVDFALNPADIEMQVFRASGAGGQHVNKTSWWSASRSAASSKTGTKPCSCFDPGSTRRRCGNRRRPLRRSAAARWVQGCATSASAPTISPRDGLPITASASRCTR